MKITRMEKIWLAVVIAFYVIYNLPMVPAYGDAKGTIIHGILSLIPLWVAVYVGLSKVCRMYRLKKNAAPIEKDPFDKPKEEEKC